MLCNLVEYGFSHNIFRWIVGEALVRWSDFTWTVSLVPRVICCVMSLDAEIGAHTEQKQIWMNQSAINSLVKSTIDHHLDTGKRTIAMNSHSLCGWVQAWAIHRWGNFAPVQGLKASPGFHRNPLQNLSPNQFRKLNWRQSPSQTNSGMGVSAHICEHLWQEATWDDRCSCVQIGHARLLTKSVCIVFHVTSSFSAYMT